MTFREDLAKASAMRAHLQDDLSMKDEEAVKAYRRAVLFTSVLAVVAIGGLTYVCVRRSRS